MKETEISASIIRELRARGCFVWKHWSGPLSKKGVADILGVLPDGRFLAVEVKQPTGRLTWEQEGFIEVINKHGGLAFVARSVEEVRQRLDTAGMQAKQRELFK
jgi:Holliday junction resolvase